MRTLTYYVTESEYTSQLAEHAEAIGVDLRSFLEAPTAVHPGEWPLDRTADVEGEQGMYHDDVQRGLLACEEWCCS